MTDLIDTTEMYLKTVFELQEEGIVALRARIAERLGHSGPTVSQTVARMERDGLLIVTGDRHLELTDTGHEKAMRVMRKHRLAERLLTDVIKLDWELVHTEACRWEHVISEDVERRLVGLLDHPEVDPYGNPIPGLDELGEAAAPGPRDGAVPLTVLLENPATTDAQAITIARIAEPLQVDTELLAQFAKAGILPQHRVTVKHNDGQYLVAGLKAHTAVELGEESARHLFVTTPSH